MEEDYQGLINHYHGIKKRFEKTAKQMMVIEVLMIGTALYIKMMQSTASSKFVLFTTTLFLLLFSLYLVGFILKRSQKREEISFVLKGERMETSASLKSQFFRNQIRSFAPGKYIRKTMLHDLLVIYALSLVYSTILTAGNFVSGAKVGPDYSLVVFVASSMLLAWIHYRSIQPLALLKKGLE